VGPYSLTSAGWKFNAGRLYVWFLNGSGAAINFGTGAGLAGSVFLYTGGLGDCVARRAA